MGSKARAFKHSLGPDRIREIARALAEGAPAFDAEAFEREALRGLEAMELKARVMHIIDALFIALPQPFPRAAKSMLAAFARDGAQREGDDRLLRGFAAWPLIDYVGVHGTEHPTLALATLRALTGRFSAEFAIRPFLQLYPKQVLAELATWTTDPDEHVRRLVSEGTRPLLPWGQRLQAFRDDPAPVLSLLETLRDDPAEYVRRSVANNLNDIAKDHPAVVVKVCRRWLRGADRNRARLVKHALRSLIKAGDPDALELLGYHTNVAVEVSDLTVTPDAVSEGGAVELRFEIRSTAAESQSLAIDYAVHFVKANGSTSPKVFKLKTLALGAGEAAAVRKKHSLKAVTTRVHYPGTHAIEVIVNGASRGIAEFELET